MARAQSTACGSRVLAACPCVQVYALTKERDALRKGSEKIADYSALIKEKDGIIKQVIRDSSQLVITLALVAAAMCAGDGVQTVRSGDVGVFVRPDCVLSRTGAVGLTTGLEGHDWRPLALAAASSLSPEVTSRPFR